MGNVAVTRRIDENSLCLRIFYLQNPRTTIKYTTGNRQAISRLLQEPGKEVLVDKSTRLEYLLKDVYILSEAKPSRWNVTNVVIHLGAEVNRSMSRVLSLMNLEVLHVDLDLKPATEVCFLT